MTIKKQEKKLKKIKTQKKKLIEKLEREEKSEKIVLLKDNLDYILTAYDMNITTEGKDILRNVADDENGINYKYLFFKSGDRAVDSYDFLKRYGSLYDLLTDLLNMQISFKKAALEQKEMVGKIRELESFVLLEEKNIYEEKSKGAKKKVKTKPQRRKTISIQKSVLNNVIRLFDKRSDIIDAFVNRRLSLEI